MGMEVSGEKARQTQKGGTEKDSFFVKVPLHPSLPSEERAKEPEVKEFLTKGRAFYRTGQGGGIFSEGKLANFPALLSPYLDMSNLRYDYPFWVTGEGTDGEIEFRPLSDLVSEIVSSFAPQDEEARVFKANLPLLEDTLRKKFSAKGTSLLEREALEEALKEMAEKLSLKGEEGEELSKSMGQFLHHLPASGILLDFSPETPLHLCNFIFRQLQIRNREAFLPILSKLKAQLKDIILLEEEKQSKTSKKEKQADYGDSFVNFSAVQKFRPLSASVAMAPKRLDRIKKALAALEGMKEKLEEREGLVILPKGLKKDSPYNWEGLMSSCKIVEVKDGELCERAPEIFEEHTGEMAKAFAALRIARLELKESYDPEVHDAFFDDFDWRFFNEEEQALCPPTLMVDYEENLLKSDMSDLSRLLISAKPLRLMVLRPFPKDGSAQGVDREKIFGFRQELGSISVSHRRSFVAQTSLGNPNHMTSALVQGLNTPFPSLFYILSPRGAESFISPYLCLGASLEARDFPFFMYDPRRGMEWGSRFNASENPQADRDWPVYEMRVRGSKGGEEVLSLPFTFADYAALDPFFSGEFYPVDSRHWNEDLISLADYLNLSEKEGQRKLPFVYMVNREGVLQKVLVSHALVLSCQERLDFWRFIQDLGGTKNYHALKAAQRVREETMAAANHEIELLKEEHAREIARVREETASEALEKLASILLELDTVSALPAAAPSSSPKSTPEAKTPSAATLPQEAVEEEEDLSFGDPYLDSFLCTSCNECININPNLFKYNGDKQAIISDPRAGTFEQLVKAAENCPAKCIHPGKPLNADEPNLDALIKRAEPFN